MLSNKKTKVAIACASALASIGCFYYIYKRRANKYSDILDKFSDSLSLQQIDYGLDIFAQMDPAMKHVDKKTFITTMEKRFSVSDKHPSRRDHVTWAAMFDLLDEQKKGYIDALEFLRGVSVLANHISIEARAKFIFQAWDRDNTGVLTREEITDAFTSAFETGFSMKTDNIGYLHSLSPVLFKHDAVTGGVHHTQYMYNKMSRQDISAKVEHAVSRIFLLADTNNEGVLSCNEFLAHAMELPLVHHMLAQR